MARPLPRIHAVSDLHGHIDVFRATLRSAGLIDEEDAWVQSGSRLWVLGDLLDRGPDGIAVIDLVRRLVETSGGQVRALLGNHDVLALAVHHCAPGGTVPAGTPTPLREPAQRIADAWHRNGGLASDQERLDADRVAWLSGLPLVGRDGDFLLQHSDIIDLLDWGGSIAAINERAQRMLRSEDPRVWFELWCMLTARHAFRGVRGARRARRVLDALGGEVIVHGHSIVGDLIGAEPARTHEPCLYAKGRALAIDGGIYAGGPCLLPDLTAATGR